MKEPWLLRVSPSNLHEKIVFWARYVYAVSFILLYFSALFGLFTTPYYFLQAKPDAPISRLFIYGKELLGGPLFVIIYVLIGGGIISLFPISLSILDWSKRK